MAVTAQQVIEKAQGFIAALAKVPGKDKMMLGSAIVGENYNMVLTLAKEAKPDLDERLWPKPVEPGMNNVVNARYADLEIFINQIIDHLASRG